MTDQSPRSGQQEKRSDQDVLKVLEDASNLNAETLRRSLVSLSTQHIKIKVLIELVCEKFEIDLEDFYERCNKERARLVDTTMAAEEAAADEEGPKVETFGGDLKP